LIRLLSIALRVLTLLEWVVRRNLNQQHKSLKGLYPGNPQRASKYPTAEKLLAAFAYITVVFIVNKEQALVHLNPLTPLQQEILALLDFSTEIYTRLAANHTQPP